MKAGEFLRKFQACVERYGEDVEVYMIVDPFKHTPGSITSTQDLTGALGRAWASEPSILIGEED